MSNRWYLGARAELDTSDEQAGHKKASKVIPTIWQSFEIMELTTPWQEEVGEAMTCLRLFATVIGKALFVTGARVALSGSG